MKVENIFEMVLLFLSLIMPMVGYAQSKTTNRENQSNHRIEVEYLTETYHFTRNNFKEYELRRQIDDLPGVVAVQINNGSSTIVVKFDKSLNSKKKLKKSFEKMGVPGKFADIGKNTARSSSNTNRRELTGNNSGDRKQDSQSNTGK